MRGLFATIASTAVATLLVLPLAALDADAGKGRGKKGQATATPVVTIAEVVDYCATYCQPAEWTLIEGTCDEMRAVCLLDDGTGQPNCAWAVKSCD